MGRNKNKSKAAQAPAQAANDTAAATRPASLLPYLAAMAGLLFLVLIAYSDSFRSGFVMDNEFIILRDPRVHAAIAANLSRIWNHTYWWPRYESGLYRPLTTLSYLFNYAVLGNGDQPAGYHWINFALHALNTILVYVLGIRLLGIRLGRRRWPAIFFAAAWAVHPVLTESVTNIVGRADLLAGFAILSGLLMYLKSTESTGWRQLAWLCGVAAVTAVGSFSKESSVAILGIIVLYELTWWRERKQLRALSYGCAAAGIPIAVMLYQRFSVINASASQLFDYVDNPLVTASFWGGRLTAISVMAKYLWLLVWPLNLSCDYSYNQIPVATGTLHDWFAWISVLAAAAFVILMYRKSRLTFFFAGFAFIAFVPVSNLIFQAGTIMAERFLYVPAIGFVGCLTLTTYWIGARIGQPKFAPVMLAIVTILFVVRTWERNLDWRDNLSLWSAAVRVSPDSFKGYDGVAAAMNLDDPSRQKIDAIIGVESKALAILDSLPDSLNAATVYKNAGTYYTEKGDSLLRYSASGQLVVPPESVEAYQESLKILLRGVAIDRALNARQRTLELKRGKLESEIEQFGAPLLYESLSLVYLRLGDAKDAYNAASSSQYMDMSSSDSYLLMGQSLLEQGQKEDAAVKILEGSIVSGNAAFFPLLQQIYKSGLDPAGCAFTSSAAGATLNNSCAVVHRDICKASAEIIADYLSHRLSTQADMTRRRALDTYACTTEEMQ